MSTIADVGFGLCLFAAVLYVLETALFPTVITVERKRYLVRWWLLRTVRRRVYLHRIYRPDAGRHLHNHPWPDARAFILWGGYESESVRTAPYRAAWRPGVDPEPTERLWSSAPIRRWHAPGTWNVLPADGYHRITRVLPNTWTLCIAGPRTRGWGFLVDGVHVDEAQYKRERRMG